MIRVLKPAVPSEVQAALSKLGRDNKTELERAREYYRTDPRPKKAFEFECYKEIRVCRALDELFHEKCAYCESNYSAVDASDIEHYRPKGGVTQCPQHPGYWWLAAAWQNLLPSCQACNRRRYHTVIDPGMTVDDFQRAGRERPDRLTGKANSFPVRNNKWVTNENDSISLEDPLLINPCERNPADHLEFFFDWDRSVYIWEAKVLIALVRPRLKAGEPDEYGEISIATYGLNRLGLIRWRVKHLKMLQGLSQPIVDLTVNFVNQPSDEQLTKIKKLVANYKANLKGWAKPDEIYTAMTEAYLQQFTQELNRLAHDLRHTAAA